MSLLFSFSLERYFLALPCPSHEVPSIVSLNSNNTQLLRIGQFAAGFFGERFAKRDIFQGLFSACSCNSCRTATNWRFVLDITSWLVPGLHKFLLLGWVILRSATTIHIPPGVSSAGHSQNGCEILRVRLTFKLPLWRRAHVYCARKPKPC